MRFIQIWRLQVWSLDPAVMEAGRKVLNLEMIRGKYCVHSDVRAF